MIKIATDGAVLTNKKHAVQGSIKVLEVNADNKVIIKNSLPERVKGEIPLFYYVGMII